MKPTPQAFDLTKSLDDPSFALTQFAPDEVIAYWPGIETLLDTVSKTWRHWTKEYIYTSLLDRNIQVWGIGPPPNAVLVFFTQVNVYPAMKVLTVVWGAGSFDLDMLPLLHATMMNYANLNGCREIEFHGREGWEPTLKSIGMKRDRVIWSIPVPDMRMN